jgi:two-component system, cell cycle response regulator
MFNSWPLALTVTAQVLGLAVLLLVGVGLGYTLRAKGDERRHPETEDDTDKLTGLSNRNRLMADLAEAVAVPLERGKAWLLVLFDLDGFKPYNEAFGHRTGDALLTRLGAQLERSLPPRGRAYRLGGDEFGVLVECTVAEVDGVIGQALAALSESGDGFKVLASHGSVLLPKEASTVKGALRLADRRMYTEKFNEPGAPGSESRDVLLTALREKRPLMVERAVAVDELALAVAEQLGMSAEERDEICRAAQLHEVGKMAVPDAILMKPAPLEESEWEFIRRSPLVAERIIASAAALVPVARLVRSLGERWDGAGYPDGLAAEQIPPGSRIVAVCVAYVAMVSERPHSVAMRPARAIEELQRGAGSQFDPATVEAFERVAIARGMVAAV